MLMLNLRDIFLTSSQQLFNVPTSLSTGNLGKHFQTGLTGEFILLHLILNPIYCIHPALAVTSRDHIRQLKIKSRRNLFIHSLLPNAFLKTFGILQQIGHIRRTDLRQ